jgi:lipoprotein signal peptidase
MEDSEQIVLRRTEKSTVTKKDILWKLAYLAIAGGVFMIDQTTKAWAVRSLRFGEDFPVISGFLNLAYDRIMGALALLLAGIAGNVVDRIRLGFVVDFIDVQFGSWHYPTFNVADMSIVLGASLLIIDMFLSKRKQKAEVGNQKLESEN